MKSCLVRIVCLAGLVVAAGTAQEVIPLYPGGDSGPSTEKQYFSNVWKTEVVSNVTKPSLTVFKPAAGTGNGGGVVICPGGGFMALSIESEGTSVAKWLAARGMTAFVLKYRLAHTGDDATQEFTTLYADRAKFGQTMSTVIPLSIADGLAALTYVRKHASEWNLNPNKVGVIGFSAGGTVAAGVGLRYQPDGRPAFVAPIYSAAGMFKDTPVPTDAPPIFLAAASDDQLGLTMDSVVLYQKWMGAHKSAEIHIYAKGGHGFGMHKQGGPSDQWIDRFGDWLKSQGWFSDRPVIDATH